MRILPTLLVSTLCIFLSGCSQQNENPSVENLGMISVMAFDYIDQDKMKMSVIMPQPASEAKKHTQLYTVETDLIQAGLVDVSSKSDKTASLRQLRVILFSEEFAKTGKMVELVLELYRDTNVRSNIYLGVVKDSAEEFLIAEYPDKPNTSTYINSVFQPKQYTYFSPFITLHDFIYDETNPVLTAIVPYLSLKDNLIHIEGIAVFKNGNMSHVFSSQKGKNIQVLRGQKRLSILAITLNQDASKSEKVVLEFIKSKVKVTSNHNFESPKVMISLKYKGKLSEYKGEKNLENKKELATLEKQVNKLVEEEIRELIEKCQELSIEPMGLFESFRMHYKGDWTPEQTTELMAKAVFEIEVDTTIATTGILK